MAAELPRFENTAVTQPTAVVSAAPGFEAMSKFGAQAEKTIAQVQQYQVGTDIINRTNKLQQEYAQKPATMENVAEFNKVYNEYAFNTMKSIAPENRAYTQRILAANRILVARKLSTAAIAQQKRTAQFAFYNGNETRINALGNNARVDDDPHQVLAMTQLGEVERNMPGAVMQGLVTPREGGTYLLKAKQTFHNQKLLGQYDTALRKNDFDATKKIRQKLMKDKQLNDVFSPADKVSINKQFDVLDKNKIAQDGYNSETYQNNRQSILFKTVNTGEGPSALELNEMRISKPKAYGNLLRDVETNKMVYHAAQPFKSGTLDELHAGISEFSRPMSSEELAQPQAFRMHHIREQTLNVLQTYAKDLKDDVGGVLSNEPVVKHAILDAQQKMNNDPATAKWDQSQKELFLLSAQAKATINLEKQKGFKDENILGLSNKTTALLGDRVKNAKSPDGVVGNPDVQVLEMNRILGSFSLEDQPYVLRNLQTVLPGYTEYMAKAAADPKQRQYISSMSQAYKHKMDDFRPMLQGKGITESSLNFAVQNNEKVQNLAESYAAMHGDNTKVFKKFTSHAVLLAAYHMQNDRNPSMDEMDEAVNKAVDNQLGSTVFRGWGTSKYQADPDLTWSQLDNAKSYMRKKAIDNFKGVFIPPNVYSNLLPNTRQETAAAMLVSTGSFVNTKTMDGIILLDSNGTPVKTKTGQNFVIPFKDLKDKNSQLNTDISAHLTKQSKKLFQSIGLTGESLHSLLGKHLQKVIEEEAHTTEFMDVVRSRLKEAADRSEGKLEAPFKAAGRRIRQLATEGG